MEKERKQTAVRGTRAGGVAAGVGRRILLSATHAKQWAGAENFWGREGQQQQQPSQTPAACPPARTEQGRSCGSPSLPLSGALCSRGRLARQGETCGASLPGSTWASSLLPPAELCARASQARVPAATPRPGPLPRTEPPSRHDSAWEGSGAPGSPLPRRPRARAARPPAGSVASGAHPALRARSSFIGCPGAGHGTPRAPRLRTARQ